MSNLIAAGVVPVANQRTGSPLRQLFEGSLWNSVAIATARLAPGILTILLTRWLSPSELGSVAFALAYYGVLSLIADWSIAYSLQKIVPENPGMEREVAGTALVIRLFFSALLALLCWSLDVTTHLFRGYGGYLAVLLIASSFGIVVCLKNAKCNFGAGSLLNVGFQVGWMCIALALVRTGLHTTGPLLGLAISYLLVGIPALFFGYLGGFSVRFLRRIAKEMIVFGSWATLAAVLSGVGTQGGLLVLAYAAGDQSAGIYRVAMTFGMLPAVMGNIVLTPLMPIVKRSLLDGEDCARKLVAPLLRHLLMLGLPVCAITAVFAHSLLAAFVHKSYFVASTAMCFCLFANLCAMFVTAFSGILFVGEGLKQLAKIHALIASIILIGTWVLANMGAVGAAVASLMAWLVGSVLLYTWLKKKVGLVFEWRVYSRYALFAFIGAGVASFLTQPLSSPLVRSCLGTCLGAALYAAFLWSRRDHGFLQLLGAIKRSLPQTLTINVQSSVAK